MDHGFLHCPEKATFFRVLTQSFLYAAFIFFCVFSESFAPGARLSLTKKNDAGRIRPKSSVRQRRYDMDSLSSRLCFLEER